MHPHDVAEHVATSVEALRVRLEQYPELAVYELALEQETRLFLGFEKTERHVFRANIQTRLVLPGGGGVAMQYEVPDLGRPPTTRRLVLHLELNDYDGTPPTAELLLPDRTPLQPEHWPKLGNGGIVPGHPDFDRPYFCRRGLREYHSHPQHEDDPWDRHREGLALHSLVLELLDDLQHRWVGRQ